MHEKPLSGLKVIELATVLAGPSVGMFMAELGAEVTKVENPGTKGDVTRHWKLPRENPENGKSAYFLSVNWGKTSVFIDISTENGQKSLHALLAGADILLLNFKPGDAEKFNLDYSTLSRNYPRLIVGNISGYGPEDPRPAFDLVMQAETGFMSMNGTAGSGPLKMPVAFIDIAAGHQLKEGLLTALYLREKTGKGRHVEVSLYESALASLANQASNYLVAGHVPGPEGSLHPNISPYGENFPCSDGRFIVLAIGTDPQFTQLCSAAGMPELATDERFRTNRARVQNRVALAALLGPFFAGHDSPDVSKKLEGAHVPFAIVKTVAEALSSPAGKAMVLDHCCVRTAVFRFSGE